jgi:transcriptional regulator with XRE-family HTH domain
MTALVREVIGDVLRRARIEQGRTLREVSDAARVSLGYLSEVERGRKEASSELLGSTLADQEQTAARQEHAASLKSANTTASIDVTTKVVIPQVVAMAVA